MLPPLNSEHNFLQIYFLGNTNDEINQRCAINNAIKREIIAQLQNLLHEHNELVKLFKTALDMMPSDDYKIVIRADKTPFGEQERRFNAPTLNEVAVVIVGENLGSRDIVLSRRDGNHLQRISETHRSYDALQYPLLFPRGEDGYHFLLKMINPISGKRQCNILLTTRITTKYFLYTGQETNKKISCMNFYAYRLMIRNNEDNHILKCRRLFHQFVVDMYAKIETERLTYIRLNQKKLRTEEYIHLRDAVNTDGNANNVGRFTILPSTYVGSPRHLHEYAQDAMTYVREYGRPDLFITFTCNPKWCEITQLLLPNQSPTDRHDITARVFNQKLKAMVNFIVKFKVFGSVRCWMYCVEWQKRGLPHAHILLWMAEKIRPDEIAEIPDRTADLELHKQSRITMYGR